MSATTRIRVIDSVFDCEYCANTVERVLLKTDGVETTTVDVRSRTLEVRFDQSQVDEERIARLVEEWGYTPESRSD